MLNGLEKEDYKKMKLKLTDREKIAKRKCETKGCPNKAVAIFKTKFLCKECHSRLNPKKNDRKFKYVNYVQYMGKNTPTSP